MNGGGKLFGFHLQLGNGTMHASVIPTMQIGMGGKQITRRPGLHSTHTSCNFYAENGKRTNTLDMRIGPLGEVHNIESTQVNHLVSTDTNNPGLCIEYGNNISAITIDGLTVKAVGGGEIKLTDVSAKNTIFLTDPKDGSPGYSNTTINISGGNFTGATFNSGTLKGKISNTVLDNATITGDFDGLTFIDVSATSIEFSKLWVTYRDGMHIKGGNFSNAKFSSVGGDVDASIPAIIEDTDFTNADFSEIQLRSNPPGSYTAIFSGVDLSGANFAKTGDYALSKWPSPIIWKNTICPDGTNSDNNGKTCINNLLL